MADRHRRFALAVLVLPLFFLVMSGLARANDIFVNTTDGESPAAPLCSLPDAVTAHNIQTPMNGCSAGNGDDRIFFLVTGTISIDESLEITNGTLNITGPPFGCSGGGPCGITIDGEGTVQIIKADSGTTVSLNTLTLNHGFATTILATNTGGGAVYANGTDLEINDCLFVNNTAQGSGLLATDESGPLVPVGEGLGGAIYGNSGAINIVNSTFVNNTAVAPAVVMYCSCAPVITVGSEGGAIYNAGAVLKVTNATIAGNTADVGAGIFNDSSASLKSNILADNTTGNCGGVAPTDVGFNISDDATCAFGGMSHNNTDPKLDPFGLQNNGGPTDTIAIEEDSPALGFIPVVDCTDQQAMPQPVGTDQRLFGRPDPYFPEGCDSGAYELGAVPPITIGTGTERVQIARNSGVANTDKVNIGLTFTSNGDPDCDLGPYGDEDALNFGFSLELFEGTCAALPNSGLFVSLAPFAVRTVNHQSYGTLFQTDGPEQVSARLLALPTPTGSCGEWVLNLEVSGLDTPALGLGGGNPFAIVLTDSPLGEPIADAAVCFDVTNAIVGDQIPTPAHGVRRRVRRGRH